jgi:transcriptional regulator with XRE-family HTH domain
LRSIMARHCKDVPEGEEPMELNRAVAENIKRIRKTKKLSMERLAQEAGVSRSMLGQIERGEANPSVALLGKLAAALKVPADVLLENDDFQSLQLTRELDTKPVRLDGGKTVLRPSLPYDEVTRQESFFLDLYISAQYAPEPSVPGCLCHATVLSGTVGLEAEEQTFQLLERDALRFAADRPYRFSNQTSASARLLLVYRYLK